MAFTSQPPFSCHNRRAGGLTIQGGAVWISASSGGTGPTGGAARGAMTQINSALILGALSAALAAAPAHSFQSSAANNETFSALEFRFQADAAMIISAAEFGGGLLADFQTRFEWEGISDNGWRWGAELGLHAQQDRAREGFSNQTGRAVPARRSLTTGRFIGGGPLTRRRTFEADRFAFFLKTGWGEWRLGRTLGAAQAETVTLPTGSAYVRLDGGPVSPDYGAAIRTLNAGGGLGPTIVYTTPRIIGLRASASFAPDASYCGIDFCREDESLTVGPGPSALDNVFEAGLSFDRETRLTGRFQLGTNIVLADPVSAEFSDDYLALGAQLRWSGEYLSAGLSALWSDNAVINGEYTAFAAAVRYDWGNWSFGAEWADARDDYTGEAQTAVQMTVSRLVGDQFSVTFGLQDIDTEFVDLGLLVTDNDSRNGAGAFFEIAFQN